MPPSASPRPSRPTWLSSQRKPRVRQVLPLRPQSPSATPLQKGSEPVPITPTEKIWLDGDLVDWDKARIHVLTHSLHYGSGGFEGIRAYPPSPGGGGFRLT